jgi:hypothetical protein
MNVCVKVNTRKAVSAKASGGQNQAESQSVHKLALS